MIKLKNHSATIFVIDDDVQVCKAIKLLMESVHLNVISFTSVQDYLETFDQTQIGCLIVDVRMPKMSGIDLQQYFLDKKIQHYPPIIVISGHADITTAVKAVQLGALDFIEKPFNNQQMIDIVHKAIKIDKAAYHDFLHMKTLHKNYQSLTKREQQVFEVVVTGKANKVIAFDLSISQSTVEAHRAKVMEKMSANNLSELVKMAILLGLLST